VIGTVILLSSRVNVIVNAYRVNTPVEHSPTPLSWVEPSLLDMSDVCARSDVQDAMKSPLTLLIRPVQIRGPSKSSDEPLNLSLHKLFILQADRSVSEVLLQGIKELSTVEDHDHPNTILLPLESYVRNMSSKYAGLEDLDDFIVQDSEDVPVAYMDSHEERNEQGYRKRDRPVLTADVAIDWQDVCESINQGSTNSLSQKRVEFDDYVQAIHPKLEKSADVQPGVRLLSDLSSPLLLVVDVEASSATIASLAESSSTNRQLSSILYRLPGRLQSKSALELYQSLLSHWLNPLPPEVPDRVRVNKERLARNIAADLALASLATRLSIRELETHAVQERIYPDPAPSGAMMSASTLELDLNDTTTHSQPASSLPPAVKEHPACVRLRAYTTVSSNAATTATPANAMDILAHLPSATDADPSAYDWRGTEATITAEYDESAETADPRVRRRAEKLAQAKRKRIQLQTKAAELVRQQAPPAIGSSQMVLPTREVQSSQVVAPERNVFGDFGPMTQPERGTFGMRLGGTSRGRKDKGTRREAGF
jgi:hypothetical protein